MPAIEETEKPAPQEESGPGDSTVTFAEIPVTKQDVLNCAYSYWYPQFEDHVFSTAKILTAPKEFVEYLQSDDIVLPKEDGSGLFDEVKPTSDNEYSDWEAGDEGEDEDEDEDEPKDTRQDPTQLFPDFHSQIKKAIAELGSVAPKLNWSAPQDATWMLMNNSMQCHNATDLYLLLKSSDYINHDLDHAFDCVTTGEPVPGPGEQQQELVLRKWQQINPSMEFRCFVRDRELVAVSQRDLNYYPFLDSCQDELLERICDFFDDVLLPKFDSNSFVFDVYIPKPLNRVYLVDINPFARKTDSLLFTWNELATMHPEENVPVFRKVNERNSGRFSSKAHSENQVPRDIVTASMDSQALIELAREWDKLNCNN